MTSTIEIHRWFDVLLRPHWQRRLTHLSVYIIRTMHNQANATTFVLTIFVLKLISFPSSSSVMAIFESTCVEAVEDIFWIENRCRLTRRQCAWSIPVKPYTVHPWAFESTPTVRSWDSVNASDSLWLLRYARHADRLSSACQNDRGIYAGALAIYE